MNCKKIIECFLTELNISKESYANAMNALQSVSVHDEADVTLSTGKEYLYKILVDVYHLNAENVKVISGNLSDISPLGRYEKNLIKHFLDYGDEKSFHAISCALETQGINQNQLDKILRRNSELEKDAISLFLKNWKVAEKDNDEVKKQDFLQSLYTRLVGLLNTGTISLRSIFDYNIKYAREDLEEKQILSLLDFCTNTTVHSTSEARKLFCEKYDELLRENLTNASNNGLLESVMNKVESDGTPFADIDTEEYALVIFNINQDLYNSCHSFSEFMDKVLDVIRNVYRVLENHKTFAIHIENVYDRSGKNIKWLLYSYIGIYAEHFIPTRERRAFYKPEQLCIDKAKYIGINITEEGERLLRDYFHDKISKEELKKLIGCSTKQLNGILMDFENVWYGYTFTDCISVGFKKSPQNKEISFIKNESSLLFIFNKYRHDDRRIPCPDCAGLNVSGNSFPEIGLRSWECKNGFCPSRSKSNRGKRYSKKSNFMQKGFAESNAYDLISRNMIRQWRRDIADATKGHDIIRMLVSYFSFHGEKILFVNYGDEVNAITSTFNRRSNNLTLERLNYNRTQNIFEYYFNDGDYIKRFLNQKPSASKRVSKKLTRYIIDNPYAVLIKGDSKSVLSKIEPELVTASVTSPPYYNARAYSQWPNLYLYLSDMQEIINQAYRVMKKGGIYLYNIGDVCGNENTVVRSNMGEKRILLGAYTVNLFLNAGFELIDNVLWDKGEPQSNRHKNDGKFTPFYQKPMNVYEHMFIFKKPGAPAIITHDIPSKLPAGWNENIVRFSPVIKINSKGENTFGHTAPFPCDIPDFVARIFTQNSSDIVLDPFAGSGTTLFSATKAGRKALGIEVLPEYCDLILTRAREEDIIIDLLDQ